MPIHGYPGNVISATPPSVTPAGASGVFTTEQQMQYQTAGNWPMAATQISRSLRFNSADSAYLNRTPGSAGNRKTFTWSAWVKRSALGTLQSLETVQDGGAEDSIAFTDTDILRVYMSPVSGNGTVTTGVFRDVSAWYHIVVAVDTTQATAANRTIIYVNGVNATSSSSNYITQNSDTKFNGVLSHYLGRYANQTMPAGNFNGYMTEVNFIDGLALTPASFGQTNSATGIWEPRQYTGPYGTNGFYLNFSDNSGTTSTTLGKDYSGNGNNWTPNNFSVTAGAGNDSLVDTPTPYGTDTGAGGEVRGNYCTLNPLYGAASTISNGNLDATYAAGTTSYGTFSFTTGKWYWELTAASAISGGYVGIMDSTYLKTGTDWSTQSRTYDTSGNKYNGSSSSYGASWGSGDVIGFAVDMDAGTIVFYKNGSSQGTAFSDLSGKEWRAMVYAASGTYNMNFGQRPFAYTAPSGYKALCTQNLPTPTIGATATTRANNYFDIVTRTGTGSTYSVSSLSFAPDLIWFKSRSNAYDNNLQDKLRGTTNTLASNLTDAEISRTGSVTSFDSNGYTGGNFVGLNESSKTYVDWMWRANGAGSSNTQGTITSTVSANTTAGFSIVTYTGNGVVGATRGHGLGVAPSMIFVKGRSNADNWHVYHSALGNTGGLFLNTTAAFTVSSFFWNDTSPSSTVFTTSSGASNNANGVTYVAYCFAPVAGYSAFGSYTGNGSTDGPFIYTGFRPAYVLIKRTNDTSSWNIVDVKRNTYNVMNSYLSANTSSAEDSTYSLIDSLSNGFKVRQSLDFINQNTGTFIYAAFAEFPFKYTLAR